MLILELDNQTILDSAERFALTADEVGKSSASAVNDVAKSVRSKKRKEFKLYLVLPARSINDRVAISQRARASLPVATVTVERRAGGKNTRPTLMSFAGKPRVPQSEGKRTKTGKLTKSARAPFSYQITRNGPRKTIPDAFVQRPTRRFSPSLGFRGISDQKAQAFIRSTAARFPLYVPRGPSLSAVYQNDETDIRMRVVEDARGRLPERLAGQSRRIYERRWQRVS